MTALPLPVVSVTLDDGPFLHAQNLDGRYLLGLDPERLLAPFFREAGLPHAEPYGNWESQGLDGHTAGHYLSATALMYAATGDPRFRQRVDLMVDGLAEAQRATGSGYVGGIPQSAQLWEQIAAGRISSASFSLDGRWVPWYNLHKTFAGLIEADRSGGNSRARAVVTALADWWLRLAGGIRDDEFERMLDTEFGGMSESFADLAALTGRADYLDMARRFAHRRILDPLAARRDELTGLHANTQVAKVLGYQRIGEQGDHSEFAAAASFFFDTVVGERTVSVGGHGVREHFHDPADFRAAMADREGPESCNSYGMIRLAGGLYAASGEARYVDYIERTMHNQVLGSQHPSHGGFVYFTPLRPRHYRVYSSPDQSFWCCVGSAMEAHARHAAHVFAERDGVLRVDLFIASTARWRGMTVVQRPGGAPDFHTELTVEVDAPLRRQLAVRIPSWAERVPVVTIDGAPVEVRLDGDYLHVDRVWNGGERIRVDFHATPRFERLPDGSDWLAVVWGPIVYAAAEDVAAEAVTTEDVAAPASSDGSDVYLADARRMGHIAHGPLAPLADTPIVIDSDASTAIRTTGADLELSTSAGWVSLQPFSGVHDRRYTLYFPTGTDVEARKQVLREQDESQLGLDAITRDVVYFGQQQPESDHDLQGDGSEAGRVGDVCWRRTATSMTVILTDSPRVARRLRVAWLQREGATEYDVLVNGELLSRLPDVAGMAELDVTIELPEALRDAETFEVELRARAGGLTDRLTELRLLE